MEIHSDAAPEVRKCASFHVQERMCFWNGNILKNEEEDSSDVYTWFSNFF